MSITPDPYRVAELQKSLLIDREQAENMVAAEQMQAQVNQLAASSMSSAVYTGTGTYSLGMAAGTPAKPTNPDDPDQEDYSSEMTPTEFILWLNGVIDVLDEHVPSQAQWDKMRDKIAAQVGTIVKRRIQHSSQPYQYIDYTKQTKQQRVVQAQLAAKKLQMEAQQARYDAQKAYFALSQAKFAEQAIKPTAEAPKTLKGWLGKIYSDGV